MTEQDTPIFRGLTTDWDLERRYPSLVVVATYPLGEKSVLAHLACGHIYNALKSITVGAEVVCYQCPPLEPEKEPARV